MLYTRKLNKIAKVQNFLIEIAPPKRRMHEYIVESFKDQLINPVIRKKNPYTEKEIKTLDSLEYCSALALTR